MPKKKNIQNWLRFKDDDGNDYPEWEVKKLGEVCEIVGGGTPETSNEYYWNGNIQWFTPTEIKSNFVSKSLRTISELGLKKSSAKILPKGAILLTTRATIGEAAIALEECTTNQGFQSLVVKKGVNNIYVFNWIKINRHELMKRANGSTFPEISKSEIEQISIPVPCLKEQEKIANFLSAIDEKIATLEKELEELQAYKKGVMQALFNQDDTHIGMGGGKSLVVNYLGKLRFKDDDGNEFPKWEKKRLGEIAEKIMYGMNAAATQYDGENKYLRITDIDENTRRFFPSPLSSPNEKIEDKYRLKEGDIVFTRTGASVGKTYLYNKNDGNLFFAGFLIKFSIKNANPYFMFLQTLLEPYNKWVQTMSMRSGQPGINAEEYKTLPLHFPCLEEQTKIANFLSSIDEKINHSQVQIEKTMEYKKGLMQKMFV